MLKQILYPLRYLRSKLYQLTYNIRYQLFMYKYVLKYIPADAKPVLLRELVLHPYELEQRYWEERKLQRRLRRWRR